MTDSMSSLSRLRLSIRFNTSSMVGLAARAVSSREQILLEGLSSLLGSLLELKVKVLGNFPYQYGFH